MNILHPLPQTIMNDLAQLQSDFDGPFVSWKEVGAGVSGTVLQHAKHSHILVKRFKDSEEWGGDEHDYDYVALEQLQGISALPLLYGYIPNEVMVMSRAAGFSVEQLIKGDKFGEKEFLIVNSSLRSVVCRCIERGWVPKDLRTRHVYWDQENSSLSLIDVGMYQPLSDYKLCHASGTDITDILTDVLEEFREHVIVTTAHHERNKKQAVS